MQQSIYTTIEIDCIKWLTKCCKPNIYVFSIVIIGFLFYYQMLIYNNRILLKIGFSLLWHKDLDFSNYGYFKNKIPHSFVNVKKQHFYKFKM